jgi:hypothetical protein
VEREAVNSRLVDALSTPGKQVVVYGPSGGGKTTLLANKLRQLYENHITTRCTGSTSFDQVILSSFDKLDVFYSSEVARKETTERSVSLGGSYRDIKLALSKKTSSESSEKATRVVPVQLSAERLAEFIGAAGCCWVVEDFHKVAPEEKKRFAQIMKVFVDAADEYPEVRVVAIGAVDTAREVVEYDQEMQHRVAEIYVPLMSRGEIEGVIAKGVSLLNLVVPQKVKADIAEYSSGVASVCHQICLNICFSMNVRETSPTPVAIQDSDLTQAISRYLEDSADTLKAAFDKALKRKRVRKYDNCRLILNALSAAGHDGATRSDLHAAIIKSDAAYPPGNLIRHLQELQTEERGELIRHDAYSGRYSFSNPLFRAYARCLFGLPPRDADWEKVRVFISHASGAIESIVTSWFVTKRSEDLRQLLLPLEGDSGASDDEREGSD